jgi:hypothetical protein
MTMQLTKRRKIVAGLATLAVVGGVALSACGPGSSPQNTENSEQQADSQSLITNQPIPHYNFSQIRQTLIDAENASADTTQTTTFFFQMGDPNPINSCPSIGFPVATNAELSNPDQVVGAPNNSSAVTGQQDPDGIYSSPSTSGTDVICTLNGGQHYLEYWEGDVYTVGGLASWDPSTHAVSVTGAPTANVHVGQSQEYSGTDVHGGTTSALGNS